MLCRILLILFLSGAAIITSAQNPNFRIDWKRTLGGTDHESGYKVITTQDGGFAVISITFSTDGHITNNKGICDVWLIKLAADGSVQWQRTYGGSNDDGAYAIQQTTDGGFIIAGYTKSNDGDVNGFHGLVDCWIIRTNANGDIQWQKAMGGSASEVSNSIKETRDGGFIFTGYTLSKNGDVTAKRDIGDNQDYWLVKLDANGNKQWDKCFGGPGHDFPLDVIETNDGGFAVSGYTQAAGSDVTQHLGKRDIWVVKTNATGVLQWQRSIGGSEHEQATSTHATADGGLIIAGQTSSNNNDIANNRGQTDALLVKLGAAGNVEWVKCYGGTQLDAFRQVIPTADGGYLSIGSTESADNDVNSNYGFSDYWMVKTTSNGTVQWQRNFGGSLVDDGFGICKAGIDSYLLSGVSFSNDHDVNNSIGGGDIWMLKVTISDPLPVIITQPTDTIALCKGVSASLSLQANDATSYSWQASINNSWQNITDGVEYSGTSTNTLDIISASSTHPQLFRCVVSNAAGSVISSTGVVQVNVPPVISIHPSDISTCTNTTITLISNANSTLPLQLLWQESANKITWNNIPSSSMNSIKTNTGSVPVEKYYRMITSNICGSDTSATAKVSVINCSIPNAFSPNGDNINDKWSISFPSQFTIQIFNRFGTTVYNNKHEMQFSWNGISKDQPLPVGIYYYVINVKNINTFSGSIALIR